MFRCQTNLKRRGCWPAKKPETRPNMPDVSRVMSMRAGSQAEIALLLSGARFGIECFFASAEQSRRLLNLLFRSWANLELGRASFTPPSNALDPLVQNSVQHPYPGELPKEKRSRALSAPSALGTIDAHPSLHSKTCVIFDPPRKGISKAK